MSRLRWSVVALASMPLVLGVGGACSSFGGEDTQGTVDGGPTSDTSSGGAGDVGTGGEAGLVGGPATEIARVEQPTSLATDADAVYVADRAGGKVYVVPKDGSAARPIATGRVQPDFLASFEKHLYWLESPACVDGLVHVHRVEKKSGSIEPVWGKHVGGENCFSIRAMAKSSSSLFVIRDKNVVQVGLEPNLASAGTTLASESAETPGVLGASDLGTYWSLATRKVLRSYAAPNGPTSDFTTAEDVEDIVIDGQTVFWADREGVKALARGATAGTVPIALAAQKGVRRLAVDKDTLYFTNADAGTVQSIAKSGGAVTTIATGQTGPLSIAVDDRGLYFGCLDGTVKKVARK